MANRRVFNTEKEEGKGLERDYRTMQDDIVRAIESVQRLHYFI